MERNRRHPRKYRRGCATVVGTARSLQEAIGKTSKTWPAGEAQSGQQKQRTQPATRLRKQLGTHVQNCRSCRRVKMPCTICLQGCFSTCLRRASTKGVGSMSERRYSRHGEQGGRLQWLRRAMGMQGGSACRQADQASTAQAMYADRGKTWRKEAADAEGSYTCLGMCLAMPVKLNRTSARSLVGLLAKHLDFWPDF